MSTAVTSPAMTTDEFLAKHVHDDGVEFVNGQLVRTPMPGNRHGKTCSRMTFKFMQFNEVHDLGHIMSHDSFIRLPNGDVYGPDLSFVSYAHRPKHLDVPEGAIDVPVDLVVEVRSISQTYARLAAKAETYVSNGVTVAIVLDPEVRSAAIYRANELPLRLHNGDIFELPDILPGFRVPVREFFE